EATGIQPGLKRRLEALLSPFADGLLKSERLEDLLAHLTLWGEAETPEGKEVVTISTYHSAKGLEFEGFICTDVHNNAFPPFFARDPAERRESRRLLYVGMTRAERRLVLTYPKIDREYERSITPFLEGVEERLSTSRPDAPGRVPRQIEP
ncbi:3'-5' exonuclease, partial [Halorubrum ezzemoulense]|uniref:3'-5' exonuclease n=1 Tax=Halorubrum ezzemoulense TaxID=337243 RepID=UPI00232AC556